MDQLAEFRTIIKRIIREWAALPELPGVLQEVVFDEAQDHYELIHTGWNGPRRLHGSVLHVDIIDGKIWIQHDGTEEGIANELVAAGIPKDRIVLAFHHPEKRKYTGFAAA